MADSIYNRAAVAPVFAGLRARRVDFAGIGDSTQLGGGYGHDHGVQFALSMLGVPMYAHGALFVGENGGAGAGTGFQAQTTTGAGVFPATGAAGTGTVSIASGSQSMTGSGTAFLTELAAGQMIKTATGNYWIASVESNTAATLGLAAGNTASGQTFTIFPLPPTELRQYVPFPIGAINAGVFPAHGAYAYVPAGGTVANGTIGLYINAATPLDICAALRADFRVGTFPSGSGAGRPGTRNNTNYQTEGMYGSGAWSNNTGAYGLTTLGVSIAASTTREGRDLSALIAVPGQTGITPPWFSTWIRLLNPGRTAGYSYHTALGLGGKSARIYALVLQQTPAAALTEIFAEYRRLQVEASQTPMVCFVIECGPNDRNDTTSSVGPSPAASNTAAGVRDNLQAIINRVQAIWTANGWATSELYFLTCIMPPISNPDDTLYLAYRGALPGLCDANARTAAIDFSTLLSFEEMRGRNLYASSSDRIHLSQAGYEQIWLRAIRDLMAPSESAVLAGTAYAQIQSGTLPLARVMQASGGNIAPADVLTTGTGTAAGGAYDAAAAQAAAAAAQLATDRAAVTAAKASILSPTQIIGADVGTLVLPAPSVVREGTTYGVGGGGSTGTMPVPVVADLADGRILANGVSELPLSIARGERRTFGLTLTDGSGGAYGLAGLSLRFLVRDRAATAGSGKLEIESGSQLTVSGSGSNAVAVTVAAAQSETLPVGELAYELWDTTTPRLLAKGPLAVEWALKDVP